MLMTCQQLIELVASHHICQQCADDPNMLSGSLEGLDNISEPPDCIGNEPILNIHIGVSGQATKYK